MTWRSIRKTDYLEYAFHNVQNIPQSFSEIQLELEKKPSLSKAFNTTIFISMKMYNLGKYMYTIILKSKQFGVRELIHVYGVTVYAL